MSKGDVIIQIRLPRWGWRKWTAAFVAVATLGAAAVYADVQWTQYTAGEKLTSAKMNANFKAMADAINALQTQVQMQGNNAPAYCGTANIQNAIPANYPAAAKACATPCNNAPTAHVCTSHEVALLAQKAVALASGAVYVTGAWAGNGPGALNDGYGWINPQAGEFAQWAMGYPYYAINAQVTSALCCK